MAGRIGTALEMVKWQHTVFALPMTLAGVVMASDRMPDHSLGWWLWKLLLIIGALFCARFAAMTYNRLVDRDIDATNPRTENRPSVTGEIDASGMSTLIGFSVLGFIVCAGLLNGLALLLSIPFLLVLLGYSHAKRFTSLAHLWLGVALGLSPLGAWIAVLGHWGWPPVLLGLAIVPWVAGFDILYALADIEHDRREGLHSLPARLGIRRSMALAALLHVLCVMALLLLGATQGMSIWYAAMVMLAAGVLVKQHRLITPEDLDCLPVAFLHCNAIFSVLVFFGILIGRG